MFSVFMNCISKIKYMNFDHSKLGSLWNLCVHFHVVMYVPIQYSVKLLPPNTKRCTAKNLNHIRARTVVWQDVRFYYMGMCTNYQTD